ncbi:hypothetical protein TNCV_2976481 [Trichonephila clavipes]|nr:hypothetical protein TNCV_2976481 [Trichonephila clavipes]
MIKRFEEAGKSGVQHGRGCKCFKSVLVDAVKQLLTTVTDIRVWGQLGVCSFSTDTKYSYSSVQKVLRNIMHYFTYKIRKPQRLSITVSALDRMTVYLSWSCNILWSDEAHFYFNGTVNTNGDRI